MTILEEALKLPVEDQYELAEALAANCGYKLVYEDTQKTLKIKALTEKVEDGYGGYGNADPDERKLIVEALEKLL